MLVTFGTAAAFGENIESQVVRPEDVTAGSLPYSEGKVVCAATVNSSDAGGLHAASNARIATGKYHVVFTSSACSNVTVVNGYSRWVQVDVLGVGEINGITCSTSDMSGNTAGITVNCTNGAGTHLDTSFFLFVAR